MVSIILLGRVVPLAYVMVTVFSFLGQAEAQTSISSSTLPTTKTSVTFSNSTTSTLLSTNAISGDTISTTRTNPPGALVSSFNSNFSSSVSTIVATSISSSPTGNPAAGSVFGRFAYAGCFSDPSGFPDFTPTSVVGPLTVQKCLTSCSSSTSAGLNANACYCGSALHNSTASTAHAGTCNIPCPGNSAEICGGTVTPDRKRLIANNLLLSVYVQILPAGSVDPTRTPALTETTINNFNGNVSFAPVTFVSSPIINNIITNINSLSIGDIYTNIIQITYLAPCGCDSIYAYSTYISSCTRTFCGCSDDTTVPAVPITTSAMTCMDCVGGGPGTVTVTVPYALSTPTSKAAVAGLSLTASSSLRLFQTGGAAVSAPQNTVAVAACSTCPGGVSTSQVIANAKYTPTSVGLPGSQFTGAAPALDIFSIGLGLLVGAVGVVAMW